MLKRIVVSILLLMGTLAGVASAFQPAAGQGDFEPVSAAPKVDALPAGPMLVVAYAFVWVALIGYVLSLWRRSQKIDRDLAELERRAQARQ
jgi:CcmD family protein